MSARIAKKNGAKKYLLFLRRLLFLNVTFFISSLLLSRPTDY